MKCPRCGADNAEQAPWCSLCQYAFQENQGGAAPPELAGQAQQYQPPPGAYQEQGGQAYPPNVGPGQYGYPPPPGAYRPGYTPPAPSQGLSTSTKVLGGIVLILVLLGLVSGGLYFILAKSPQIKVTPPPGWKVADEELKKKAEEASVQGKDAKLDYLFSDGSLSNTIMIMHGKVFKMDTPDSEKYEDVKSFFEEHQDEYISQLQTASNSYNVSLKTTTAEVVEMACGSGAIHVSFMIRGNGAVVVTDYLDFYKKGTEYVALVLTMGDQGNQEELDHLINNISF